MRPRDLAGKTRRRLAAEQLAELVVIEKKIKASTKELKAMVLARGSTLMELHGVGPVIAARILADVGDVARFANRNRFASWTCTAPLDASSGEQNRHRLSRAGNRRMNHMIHIAAVTQLRLDTPGRAYYRRKRTAGKRRMEAMRCLKRRISDAVYRQLLADAQRLAGAGPGGHCGATQQSSAVVGGGQDVYGLGAHYPEMGRPATRRGASWHGRPIEPSALEPSPDLGTPQASDRAASVAPPAGPVQIGGRLNMPASTVHAVLVRCRLNRLSHIDRVTGEPIRRYEHPHPGALIHVDVTKFGNIPDGGGHRFLSRQESKHNAQATARRTGERGKHYKPVIDTAFVHTVVDDHTRIAYAEICADEKGNDRGRSAATRRRMVRRARGVSVERVLFDNGACYRSFVWRDA